MFELVALLEICISREKLGVPERLSFFQFQKKWRVRVTFQRQLESHVHYHQSVDRSGIGSSLPAEQSQTPGGSVP
jgi:hypothetical protein